MTSAFPPSKRLLIGVAVTCWLAAAFLPAAPVISEFLASNTTGLLDQDGARPDWIEIHNPDGAPVDLAGHHLTDDAARPTRWTFPSPTVVPAGGYLIVFASGKNRALSGQELHTNFSLSANGEYLGLIAPGGAPVIDEYAPTFPPQTENKSYGLLPGSRAYFNVPSPGAMNDPAQAPAESVQFSVKSRTFASTFQLSLTTLSPTATIRYTTNQTKPTAASTLYTSPITISATTRVRAIAFEVGRPDGPVVSEFYMKLSASAPPTHQSNLPFVVIHKWSIGTPANDTVYPTAFLIFEPTGTPTPTSNVTAQIPTIAVPGTVERRGSSTAGAAKFSLAMETQNESDIVAANDLNITPFGLPAESDWILHAPYEFDRSLMHNDLIYRLSNDIGRYASRTRFVEVYLNTNNAELEQSDYFGVYSFQEKIKRDDDRVNVEELTTADNTAPNVQGGYMFKADRLDPGEPGLTGNFGGIGTMGAGVNLLAWVTPKSVSADPAEIVTTAQSNYLRSYIESMWTALSGASFMHPVNGYAQYLDPAAAIDHHILNVAAKSADAFRLSAFWHKPRFGRLTAGPIWDFDRAQGSTDGRDLNPNTWRGDTGDLGTDFFHYPWYNELFKDPNFWQAWVDRFHQLRQGAFATANIHALIDQFAAQLSVPVGGSTPHSRNLAKWPAMPPRGATANTPGTNGTYAGEVQWLKNWWTSRLNFMDGQFTRPAVSSLAGGPVPIGSQVTLTSPSTSTPGVKIYYTTNGTDPRETATQPIPPISSGPILATPIPEISPVRAIVPTGVTTGGPTGVEWRGVDTNGNGSNWDDFDHSTWFSNPAGTINGVGYDDSIVSPAVNYLPYIGIRWSTTLNVVAPHNNTNRMRDVNGSCYARHAFTLSAADAALLVAPNRLVLSVRYDDGYVAWINGTQVNMTTTVPVGTTPAWNTVIPNTHDDTASTQYEEVDLSAYMSLLHVGENILALQGINGTSTGSSDQVLQCKLFIQGQAGGYVPEISPAASQYTGPLTINAPTQLFVRTLNPARPSDPPTVSGGGTGTVPNGTGWSAPAVLYYFPGAVSASQASIQITEVNYHPPAPTAEEILAGFSNSNDFEFIRLTNTGASPVDLTGIYFSNGLEFTAGPGLQNWLPAGQSVVVVENLAAFQSRYGAAFTVLGQFNGELDDGGEHIVLNDRTSAVISDFIYGDAAPWPDAADGDKSLLYAGGDQNDPASWRASVDPGGSAVRTFAQWQSRHFSPASIPAEGPMADSDFDGWNNLTEYAFGSDPRTPNSRESQIATVDPGANVGLTVIRRKGASDLSYVFETASDLAGWSPGPAPESVVDNGDGTETATYRPAPGAATRLFLRVRVTSP